jgi:PPOX class probable F420-dependent enzyme
MPNRIGRRRDSAARSVGVVGRVNTPMTNPTNLNNLDDSIGKLLAGRHLSVLATANADGQPQTSVIFVKRDGDDIVFSTIKGRRKTTNMVRDPRVNLLVHSLETNTYATISGRVELTDDADGSFHQVMYDLHMGGATPPPEPGAERVIVRIRPQKVYVQPPNEDGSAE